MRLDIRYTMRFVYDEPVREAHSEIRVRPRDLPVQRLLAHRLTASPPSRILSFTDYWGTTVDHLGHVFDHDEYQIVAEAAVETRPHDPVGTAPLEALHDAAFASEHVEYLQPSNHVQWSDELGARAHRVIHGEPDVASAVHRAIAEVNELVRYERDSTHIGISLDELVAGGRGVCQDLAHLTIGLLRAGGIPARYVSGYLFARDETAADDDDHVVEVQTHAWVEAAVPGVGWLPVDPTNDKPVGERHVTIGHGRDYDDVAPVRGVYVGAGTPAVEASVEMRRMEPVERTMTERPHRRDRIMIPHRRLRADAAQQHQQQQQQQQQ